MNTNTILKMKEVETMGKIKILNPGMMTTVQDLGRGGYQQFGVSISGAMDQLAARICNILVGNVENEGLLEVTIMGPKIEFLDTCAIAITGGNLQPAINNKPINMNRSIRVNQGDILSFNGIKKGCRSYIGFSGGIDVPVVMGSKSTFLKAKIGGFEGRVLKVNDILSIGNMRTSPTEIEGIEAPTDFYDYGGELIELRTLLGPQDDAFTEDGIKTLFSGEYTVTNNSDRMGYTLEGPEIEHKEGADIISDGISMGAIQIPNKGTPIIMMADRQTTGGYTKIGNVITADLPKVAQAKPGDKIIFKESSLEEAHDSIRDLENKFMELKKEIERQRDLKRDINKISYWNMKINGKSYSVKVEEITN